MLRTQDKRLQIGKTLPQILTGRPTVEFSAARFTDLPQIDNFTRANEDPLSKGGEWITSTVAGATVTCEISSNQCAQLDAATTGYSIYGEAYDTDQAVCATIPVLAATGDFVSLHARAHFHPTVAGVYSYAIRALTGDGSLALDRFDNSTFVNLANPAVTWGAGDSIGLVVIGNRIEAWHKPAAGAWTAMASVTDTTYPTGGMVGIGIRDTLARASDFRGGSLV